MLLRAAIHPDLEPGKGNREGVSPDISARVAAQHVGNSSAEPLRK